MEGEVTSSTSFNTVTVLEVAEKEYVINVIWYKKMQMILRYFKKGLVNNICPSLSLSFFKIIFLR